MKRNIFLITAISFILIFTVLYILINFNYNIRLKTAIDSEKQTTVNYLTIAVNEIKNNYLKADDISLLYSIEYLSKIKNISEVFIIDKTSTVLIHNDSNKWNKKLLSDVYDNVISSKEQLIQTINRKLVLYSLPLDDTTFVCFLLSFEDIINNYSTWKNKLYLFSLILSLVISVAIYLLCYILFLKPFTKTKKILTLKDNNKRTIYFELIDMVKKDNIVENKYDLKTLNLLKIIIDKFNKENKIVSVLDNKANIIYRSNIPNNIFKSLKTNIHIMEATDNSEMIKAISVLLEKPNDTKTLTINDSEFKIEPLLNSDNKLVAIIITKCI